MFLESIKPFFENLTPISSRAWNLATGIRHYAGICSAVIPSVQRPVLTRFEHALELCRAQHFTFHCRVTGRGYYRGRGGGGNVNRAVCASLYHFGASGCSLTCTSCIIVQSVHTMTMYLCLHMWDFFSVKLRWTCRHGFKWAVPSVCASCCQNKLANYNWVDLFVSSCWTVFLHACMSCAPMLIPDGRVVVQIQRWPWLCPPQMWLQHRRTRLDNHSSKQDVSLRVCVFIALFFWQIWHCIIQ